MVHWHSKFQLTTTIRKSDAALLFEHPSLSDVSDGTLFSHMVSKNWTWTLQNCDSLSLLKKSTCYHITGEQHVWILLFDEYFERHDRTGGNSHFRTEPNAIHALKYFNFNYVTTSHIKTKRAQFSEEIPWKAHYCDKMCCCRVVDSDRGQWVERVRWKGKLKFFGSFLLSFAYNFIHLEGLLAPFWSPYHRRETCMHALIIMKIEEDYLKMNALCYAVKYFSPSWWKWWWCNWCSFRKEMCAE